MKLNVEVEVPEGFRAEKKEGELVVTKGDKSLRRALPRRKLSVKITGNKVSFSVVDKKDRALVGTFVSHIKNMTLKLISMSRFTAWIRAIPYAITLSIPHSSHNLFLRYNCLTLTRFQPLKQ